MKPEICICKFTHVSTNNDRQPQTGIYKLKHQETKTMDCYYTDLSEQESRNNNMRTYTQPYIHKQVRIHSQT